MQLALTWSTFSKQRKKASDAEHLIAGDQKDTTDRLRPKHISLITHYLSNK